MSTVDSIPGQERSTASKVALPLLCVLVLCQSAVILWLLSERATPRSMTPTSGPAAAVLTVDQPPTTPISTAAASSTVKSDIIIPPLPTLGSPPSNKASLPSLPRSTGPGMVPPLPVALPPAITAALQNPLPTSSSSAPAGITHSTTLLQQARPMLTPQAPPATKSNSLTGSADVDEILNNARQLREMGVAESALDELRKADLMLPDNPVVKRELAFTLQKMGRMEEARIVLQGGGGDPLIEGGGDIITNPSESLVEPLDPNLPGAAPLTMPLPEVDSLNPSMATGPIRLGQCEMQRDMSAENRMTFTVPLLARPSEDLNPSQMNVDVFFYEQWPKGQIELRRGAPAQFSFDDAVDFSSGKELLNVSFDLPSEEDLTANGSRKYHGYIVRLYYQQQLIDTQASPTSLLSRPQ